jgi:hypothetical protein
METAMSHFQKWNKLTELMIKEFSVKIYTFDCNNIDIFPQLLDFSTYSSPWSPIFTSIYDAKNLFDYFLTTMGGDRDLKWENFILVCPTCFSLQQVLNEMVANWTPDRPPIEIVDMSYDSFKALLRSVIYLSVYHMFMCILPYIYIPSATECRGGILESACLSVRLSVCLSSWVYVSYIMTMSTGTILLCGNICALWQYCYKSFWVKLAENGFVTILSNCIVTRICLSVWMHFVCS